MLLTEARASELVAEWLRHVTWIAPTRAPGEFGFSHTRVSVEGQLGRKALRVRRAMEGLNALACCGGFDPEANPMFWHREFRRRIKTRGRSPRSLPHWQRLTSDPFSRYLVTPAGNAWASQSAYGLATCLSMEATSPAMNERRAVLAQLQAYLVTQPPPLDLVLGTRSPCDSMDADADTFLATLQDLAQVHELLSESGTLKVALGCEDALFPLTRRLDVKVDLCDALQRTRVVVSELHAVLANDEWTVSRFQDALAAVSVVDTIEVMTLKVEILELEDTVYLCSALATMQSLHSMDLRPAYFGGNREHLWLAFALRRRRQRGLALAFTTNFNPHLSDAFVRAMLHEETFACLIPAKLRHVIALEYFPLGTTAMAANQAVMTQDLLMGERRLTSNGRRVDVLASARTQSIVVVPAYGLMWIQTNALSAWDQPQSYVPRSVLSPPPVLYTLRIYHSQYLQMVSEPRVLDDSEGRVVAVTVSRHRTALRTEEIETLIQRLPSVRSLTTPLDGRDSLEYPWSRLDDRNARC